MSFRETPAGSRGGHISALKNPETIGRPKSLLLLTTGQSPELEINQEMPLLNWKKNQDARKNATAYATRSDFQEIFTEDMAGLHLLAFLLTADQEKAEQCLAAAKSQALARLGPLPPSTADAPGNGTVSWASFLAPTQLA